MTLIGKWIEILFDLIELPFVLMFGQYTWKKSNQSQTIPGPVEKKRPRAWRTVRVTAGGILLTAYLAIGWYSWQYIHGAFIWTMDNVFGPPFMWIFDGGLVDVANVLLSLGVVLWGFEIFRMLIYVFMGGAAVRIFYAWRNYRNHVKELEKQIKQQKWQLDDMSSSIKRQASAILEVASSLEAMRRRALTQREKAKSQVGEAMRLEIECILKAYPFDRFNAEAEKACLRWEERFRTRHTEAAHSR